MKHFIGSPYPASPCRYHVLAPSHVFRSFVSLSPVSTTSQRDTFLLCPLHSVFTSTALSMGNTSSCCACTSCCCQDCFGSKPTNNQTRCIRPIHTLSYAIERHRSGIYEPLLQANEREAIAELLRFLESKC